MGLQKGEKVRVIVRQTFEADLKDWRSVTKMMMGCMQHGRAPYAALDTGQHFKLEVKPAWAGSRADTTEVECVKLHDDRAVILELGTIIKVKGDAIVKYHQAS